MLEGVCRVGCRGRVDPVFRRACSLVGGADLGGPRAAGGLFLQDEREVARTLLDCLGLSSRAPPLVPAPPPEPTDLELGFEEPWRQRRARRRRLKSSTQPLPPRRCRPRPPPASPDGGAAPPNRAPPCVPRHWTAELRELPPRRGRIHSLATFATRFNTSRFIGRGENAARNAYHPPSNGEEIRERAPRSGADRRMARKGPWPVRGWAVFGPGATNPRKAEVCRRTDQNWGNFKL